MESKREGTSAFRIILGFAFFVISIAWITNKLLENESIGWFDWVYTGIFALNGVVHLLQGFGVSIVHIFRKD